MKLSLAGKIFAISVNIQAISKIDKLDENKSLHIDLDRFNQFQKRKGPILYHIHVGYIKAICLINLQKA